MEFSQRTRLNDVIVPWSDEELSRKDRLFQLREMYAAESEDEGVISGLVQSHLLLLLAETCRNSLDPSGSLKEQQASLLLSMVPCV